MDWKLKIVNHLKLSCLSYYQIVSKKTLEKRSFCALKNNLQRLEFYHCKTKVFKQPWTKPEKIIADFSCFTLIVYIHNSKYLRIFSYPVSHILKINIKNSSTTSTITFMFFKTLENGKFYGLGREKYFNIVLFPISFLKITSKQLVHNLLFANHKKVMNCKNTKTPSPSFFHSKNDW